MGCRQGKRLNKHFVKEAPVFQFKAALLDGHAVPTSEIQSIASLPSREQLIAKILFLVFLVLFVASFVLGRKAPL